MSELPLHFGRDNQGFNAYAPQPPTLIYNVLLNNSDESTLTLPSQSEYWIVVYAYENGTTIYVDEQGGTAAVPSSSTFTLSTTEIRPAQRTLKAGTQISMVTEDTTAAVSVMLWAINNV